MDQRERVGATGAAPTDLPQVERRSRGFRTWVAVLLSILVVGGGLGFLVADSLRSAQYYKTIAEVRQASASLQGKRFRVAGRVVPGSLETRAAGAASAHRFRLVEDGQELVVHYGRPLPDSFTDGVEVVVAGSLLASGEFAADELLARCPSKYEAERTPEAMGAARNVGAATRPGGGHPADVPRQGAP